MSLFFDCEVRRLIAERFNNVDEWSADPYLLVNTKKNVSFWIANGLFFFQAESGMSYRLNFIDKVYLWNKAKRLLKKLAIRQLTH